MVAGFSPQQQSSFQMGSNLAANGVPNVGQASGALTNAANVGPQSVNANTISSAMSPYMNQYVMQALQPQLTAQDQQFAAQNQNLNAQATSSGAFGDARAGIQAANLTQNQDIARQGLIGQAYNSAFNTAIGAGAQDVSNNLNAQTTNANLMNQFAQQQQQVAQGWQNLGGYQVGQGTALTNLQNTLGQQQTAQSQAGLNAQYQQYLMAQQYPFMTAQLANQTTAAGAQAMPANSTRTTTAPDNSGWQALGAIGGAALGSFAGPMGTSLGASLGGALGGGLGGGSGGTMGTGSIGPGGPGGGGPSGGSYADGGSPPVGVPSVVGERGPELFVPTQPGVIVPHEMFRAAAAARASRAPVTGDFRGTLGMAA